MSSEKTVFILNPRSAGGETRRRFERVRPLAQRLLKDIDVLFTDAPDHATALARSAVEQGARCVVGVGGDGTLNEVVNGFFSVEGQRLDSPTAMGFVTSGTGGDFRRSLSTERNVEEDIKRLARHSTEAIDVGRVDFVSKDNKPAHRFFINIASVGFSAEVVNTVNASSKRLGAKASFLGGTVRALLKSEGHSVSLSIDDAPYGPGQKLTFAAVANGAYFGGGMKVAPNAEINDGQFELILAEHRSVTHWLKHGLKIYKGEHLQGEEFQAHRCAKVGFKPTVEGATILLELDGEQPGQLPATFAVLEKTIHLVV